VAGNAGPTFGTDGTLFVATTKGAATPPSPFANRVVALDRKTLQPKDWLTTDGADFNASPVVFKHKARELVAVSANDGRLYLLDAQSLGGADHRTPLHVTAKYSGAGPVTNHPPGRGAPQPKGPDVMTVNGHCTYLPGNKWILNDTYPDSRRLQNVYLYQLSTGKRFPLGSFHSPEEYTGEWRCDTHPPRYNRSVARQDGWRSRIEAARAARDLSAHS
jgi:hypothetical protein